MYKNNQLKEIYDLITQGSYLKNYKELEPFYHVLQIIFKDTLLFDAHDIDSYQNSCTFIYEVINLVTRIPLNKIDLVTHHLVYNNRFSNKPNDYDYLNYLNVLFFPSECCSHNLVNYLYMFSYIYDTSISVIGAKVNIMKYNGINDLMQSIYYEGLKVKDAPRVINQILGALYYQNMELFSFDNIKTFYDNYDYYTSHILMNIYLSKNVDIMNISYYRKGRDILLFISNELNKIILEIAKKNNQKKIK